MSRNFNNKEYFFEKILGFDKMRGIEDFDPQTLVTCGFGASELSGIKDMLVRIKSIKRPYVFQFMSVNYHGPFAFSRDFHEVVQDVSYLKSLNEGDQILHYLDASLKYFFNEMKKMPDYDKTIFIITTDHGGGIKYDRSLSQFDLIKLRNHLPLLIYSPLFKSLDEPMVINDFINLFSVTPILLDILNIKARNNFIGIPKSLYLSEDEKIANSKNR